jgi:hypothetical protein
MDEQSTIQTELTRVVAVYLGKGMSPGSIGLELLTLGIVMLTNWNDLRRVETPSTASDRPLETGYSAIG